MTSPTTQTTGDATDATETVDRYLAARQAAAGLAAVLREGVIEPLARAHYEADRGHALRSALPTTRSDSYHFEAGPFEADVFPRDREVDNFACGGRAVTAENVLARPDAFRAAGEAIADVWRETFGPQRHMASQPDHPGAPPLDAATVARTLDRVEAVTARVEADPAVGDLVDIVARDDRTYYSAAFGVELADALAPGGHDLWVVQEMADPTTVYADDTVAVLRDGERDTGPERGLVVGVDDTPEGAFAHAVDVTNLAPDQSLDRDAVRAAMGFDDEIDPYDPRDRVPADGRRVRLQGDLRVRRVGPAGDLPGAIERRVRRTTTEERVQEILSEVVVSAYVPRGRGDATAADALAVEADADTGDLFLQGRTTDRRVPLALASVAAHLGLPADERPAPDEAGGRRGGTVAVDDEPAIFEVPGVRAGGRRGRPRVAFSGTTTADLRSLVVRRLERELRDRGTDPEAAARTARSEAEGGLDVPRQVNVPVDNHMVFVEAGHAPDVDTVPVPVGVPEETTLHIVHGEHNDQTLTLAPGLYQFDLLPRGLRPADDRPTWPAPGE